MTFIPSENKTQQNYPDSLDKGDLPFMESDEAFLKKKPVNLLVTLSLLLLAAIVIVVVLKDFYRKAEQKERTKWETGRLLGLQKEKRNDIFQPLRNGWRNHIKASVVTEAVNIRQKKQGVFVIVENTSPHQVAMIVVNAFHLNRNHEVDHTEPVIFNNIKPNEIKRIELKSVKNKEAVKVQIKSVTAPSFNFCYSTEIDAEGQSDPYYCPEGKSAY